VSVSTIRLTASIPDTIIPSFPLIVEFDRPATAEDYKAIQEILEQEPTPRSPAMPIKILHQNHTELVGTGYVLLTSPQTSGSDQLYPTHIVEDAALSSRAYAAIGKNNRATDDEQVRTAGRETSERINEIVQENGIKCILEICAKQE